MKKLKHSKYKNTGILFEILVRKLTSETLSSNKTLTVEEIFATILKNQFSNNKLSKNAKNQIQLTLDEIDDVNQNPNLLKKLLFTWLPGNVNC